MTDTAAIEETPWHAVTAKEALGRLETSEDGIGVLLEHASEVTVLPVSIDGAFEAWPRGRRLPRPGRIVVRYGKGVSVAALGQRGTGGSDRDRILDVLRAAIRKLQDED